MEPPAEPANPTPAAPKTTPVMDVTPPPAVGMATPPAEDAAADQQPTPEVAQAAHDLAAAAAAKPPKPPKQPSAVPMAAIVATVVIVLGIAGLAVYAYLQAKK